MTASALAAYLEAQCPCRCSTAAGALLTVNVTWEHAALLRSLLPADLDTASEQRIRLEGFLPDAKLVAVVDNPPRRYPYLAAADAALAWQQLPDPNRPGQPEFLLEYAYRHLRDAPFGQPYPDVSAASDLLATLITDALGTTPGSAGGRGFWVTDLSLALQTLATHPHLAALARAETRIAERTITGRDVTVTRPPSAPGPLARVEPR